MITAKPRSTQLSNFEGTNIIDCVDDTAKFAIITSAVRFDLITSAVQSLVH